MKKLLVPLLITFFLFLSCKKVDLQMPNPSTPGTDTTSIKDSIKPPYFYLALGDSYTIGQSVPEQDRYPVQAVQLLLKDSINFAPPEIIARTGWTTGNLISAINSTPPSRSEFDIVTLLIGVNNQYRGLDKIQYKNEFTLLLEKAIAFAKNKKERVIVLSIPDYSVTPFVNGVNANFIATEINIFNAINKDVTLQYGIKYIDITPSTRLAANDLTLLASDGLHPSGKEYKKWADSLAPAIKATLK